MFVFYFMNFCKNRDSYFSLPSYYLWVSFPINFLNSQDRCLYHNFVSISFLINAIKVINFPPSTALAALHKFRWCYFHFIHFKGFSNFHWDTFLHPRILRGMLFCFHKIMSFLITFLLHCGQRLYSIWFWSFEKVYTWLIAQRYA